MEFREIKKIVELVAANDLSEFEIEEEDFRLSIRRGGELDGRMMPTMLMPQQPVAAQAAPASVPSIDTSAAASAPDADDKLLTINSPIVGTFYRSPSPDADPYVSVGDEVSTDKTVCIIEAMKVMNEIPAECSGVIAKILVEDGTPVEYGQPLFKVDPL